MTKDNTKESNTKHPKKLSTQDILEASKGTLYKPLSDSIPTPKPEKPHPSLNGFEPSDHTKEKAKELIEKTGLDASFIAATNPAIAYITDFRNRICNEQGKTIATTFKETNKDWRSHALRDSMHKDGVPERRYKMAASSAIAETALSGVLPKPEGIKNATDAGTVAVRTATKAALEFAFTFGNETSKLQQRFAPAQDLTQVRKKLAAPIALRLNSTWAPVEVVNAQQHETETAKMTASLTGGAIAGAVAGAIDYSLVHSKIQQNSTAVVKSNPRALATACFLRCAHSAITTTAFVLSSQTGNMLNDMRKSDNEETAEQETKPPAAPQSHIKRIIQEHKSKNNSLPKSQEQEPSSRGR